MKTSIFSHAVVIIREVYFAIIHVDIHPFVAHRQVKVSSTASVPPAMRVSLRCNLPLADGSEDSTDEELLRSLGHNGSGGRAFRLPNKALLQIDCGKTIWFIFFSTFLKFVITRSLTFCSSLLKICKLLSIISLLSHEILTYRCFGCSL